MPGWTFLRPVCGTSLNTYVAAPLTSGCSVRDIGSLLFTNEFSLGEAGGTPLLVERSDVRVVPEPTVRRLPVISGEDPQVQ